ncbi:MAG: hypothetical protein A2796_00945 [Chlamydiae bacterium RIFCSPHIGHO2_01_FULL_44_39]|nr:MAG: hypothetical protein A2796_00945 [Chlamydiae bacterium RIFCSPHIGHO2_01_FULL_44_39]OGN58877.1 MAG: hypothetical protein A3C42_05065 [Chlamydiae bacterium RIFCSPHIGHO2_02_FULL_45_9]OGN65966.1 MAG: hypothetical protein A2978_04660 [Chlamydiae bacterium RIFCSPLOWO2_01_FULL_44_52]
MPFILGDEEGFLTSAIIEQLSVGGLVDVVSSGGDYVLQVAIVACNIEKIGFRIDPQEVEGKVRNNLLATEGRKSLSVKAGLYRSGELVHGPYTLTAEADYDYVDGDSIRDLTFVNPEGITVTVLPFSLGQLEPINSAESSAQTPLYRQIAKKIVDALSSSLWNKESLALRSARFDGCKSGS